MSGLHDKLLARAEETADEGATLPFGQDRACMYAYSCGMRDAVTYLRTGVMPKRPGERHLRTVKS